MSADAGISASADAPLFLRDLWYMAGFARNVGRGQLRRVILLGEPIAIGRMADGSVFALRDICPHRGVPLSAGRIDQGTVECPYHGWRFKPDGVCAAIPSLVDGQEMDPTKIRVRAYPAREQDGLIWVFMPSKDGNQPKSEPPKVGVPDARPRWRESQTFACAIDHAVSCVVHEDGIFRTRRLYCWQPIRRRRSSIPASQSRKNSKNVGAGSILIEKWNYLNPLEVAQFLLRGFQN